MSRRVHVVKAVPSHVKGIASLLSCGGGWSVVLHQVFWKPAKISTGYASNMTNQKRYTTVMPGTYYYQFVRSKLHSILSMYNTYLIVHEICHGYAEPNHLDVCCT